MPVHKPISMILPEHLIQKLEQSLEQNPPAWSYKMEYFYILINYMIEERLRWKKEEEVFLPLDLGKLKAITTTSIDRYIKYLVNEELILHDHYIKGKRSYHYRINPNCEEGTRKVHIEPGSRAFDLFRKDWNRERNNVNRLKPYLKQMRDLFMKLELDESSAMEWIETQVNPRKRYYHKNALLRFSDVRSRYFHRNDTNKRLDTNLTSLKKELRGCLVGDWVSIDLANSQPFLLSQLLEVLFYPQEQYKTTSKPLMDNNYIPLCPEFLSMDLSKWFGKQQVKKAMIIPHQGANSPVEELLNMQISCIEGAFYDDFIGRLRLNGTTRDQVKKAMLSVMFSRNEIYRNHTRMVPYQKEKELFAKVYPNTLMMIEALKSKDHRKLAVLLQRVESMTFIDTICPRLVDEGIVPLTVHDSIIVEKGQVERALEVCKDVFSVGFGVIPTFHVEPLNKDDYDEGRGFIGRQKSLCQAVEEGEPGEGTRLSAQVAC